MTERFTFRVFISYTGQDLSAHADVVAYVLRTLQHLAIDHRDSGSTGQPSVDWCMDQVDEVDFVVVLVAHRYGWIPTLEEGGDGRRSITQMEVDRAKAKRKIVLPYIVEDGTSWPTKHIEALVNQDILIALQDFKADLRKTVAAFFTELPSSLEGPLSRDIPKAIERIRKKGWSATAQGGQARAPSQAAPWLYDPKDPPSVAERMVSGFPKRILSIRGGGIEAAIAVGYLERIERLLQVRYGDEAFRLADYFDLIGGVGPSSILALELARRRTVKDAADTLSHILTRAVRYPRFLRFLRKFLTGGGVLSSLYDQSAPMGALKDRFGDTRLRDAGFATGCSLVATDLEESQPAFISNHPELVADWAEASVVSIVYGTSMPAPYLFPLATIEAADGRQRVLSDGEYSVGPDPGLALLLLATSPRYPYRWRLGENRLSLTSVGSLRQPPKNTNKIIGELTLVQILRCLNSMSAGAGFQSRMLLDALATQVLGDDVGLFSQSTITYRSYETAYDDDTLTKLQIKGMGDLTDLDLSSERWGEFCDRFIQVGIRAAAIQIEAAHFSDAFDVRVPIAPPGR